MEAIAKSFTPKSIFLFKPILSLSDESSQLPLNLALLEQFEKLKNQLVEILSNPEIFQSNSKINFSAPKEIMHQSIAFIKQIIEGPYDYKEICKDLVKVFIVTFHYSLENYADLNDSLEILNKFLLEFNNRSESLILFKYAKTICKLIETTIQTFLQNFIKSSENQSPFYIMNLLTSLGILFTIFSNSDLVSMAEKSEFITMIYDILIKTYVLTSTIEPLKIFSEKPNLIGISNLLNKSENKWSVMIGKFQNYSLYYPHIDGLDLNLKCSIRILNLYYLYKMAKILISMKIFTKYEDSKSIILISHIRNKERLQKENTVSDNLLEIYNFNFISLRLLSLLFTNNAELVFPKDEVEMMIQGNLDSGLHRQLISLKLCEHDSVSQIIKIMCKMRKISKNITELFDKQIMLLCDQAIICIGEKKEIYNTIGYYVAKYYTSGNIIEEQLVKLLQHNIMQFVDNKEISKIIANGFKKLITLNVIKTTENIYENMKNLIVNSVNLSKNMVLKNVLFTIFYMIKNEQEITKIFISKNITDLLFEILLKNEEIKSEQTKIIIKFLAKAVSNCLIILKNQISSNINEKEEYYANKIINFIAKYFYKTNESQVFCLFLFDEIIKFLQNDDPKSSNKVENIQKIISNSMQYVCLLDLIIPKMPYESTLRIIEKELKFLQNLTFKCDQAKSQIKEHFTTKKIKFYKKLHNLFVRNPISENSIIMKDMINILNLLISATYEQNLDLLSLPDKVYAIRNIFFFEITLLFLTKLLTHKHNFSQPEIFDFTLKFVKLISSHYSNYQLIHSVFFH